MDSQQKDRRELPGKQKKAKRNGYSASNWPPMVAPQSEPTIRNIPSAKPLTWAVLTFSYHERRWDYWCSFPTLAKASYYCVGKFGDGPTQRIVRVNASRRITRIIRRGKEDQLS